MTEKQINLSEIPIDLNEDDAGVAKPSENPLDNDPTTELPPELYEPPPRVLSLEEKKKKYALIRKIRAYFNSSFASALRNYIEIDLESRFPEELEELLEEIRYIVNQANNKTFGHQASYSIFSVWEALMIRGGIQAQGVSGVLYNNPDVKSLVEEVLLEYQDYLHVKPIYKLSLIMLTTTMQIDSVNRAKANLAKKAHKESTREEKKVGQDVVDSFRDI